MKKYSFYIAIIIGVVIIAGILLYKKSPAQPNNDNPISESNMIIRSLGFENKGEIPSKYTCDGENTSPAMIFSEVPEDTVSLTLISHDPDASAKGGWTHWVVINMPPNVGRIPANGKPSQGLETATSFGTPGYGGPCPPSGSHRYYFRLYALDTMLDLDESATKEDVEEAMKGHIIAETELMGRYQKN